MRIDLLIPKEDGSLDLWQLDEEFNTISLVAIKSAEWSALSMHIQPRGHELAMLAGVLNATGSRMGAFGVSALAQDCSRLDREVLSEAALEGFEALSAAINQALSRLGAGLRFIPEAEPDG